MGSKLCAQPTPPLLLQIGTQQLQTSNAIKTTNYNIFTFLPLATLIQFKRVANIYFLVTAILQFIPIISPLSPISAIAPLIFVLTVSLIRTGIEEYGKYKFDKESNSNQFQILQNHNTEEEIIENSWVAKRSDQLRVGNIIKIYQDSRLPADIILLSTTNKDGKCYLQTSSLDGQKNLKNRMVLPQTQSLYSQQNLKTIYSKMDSQPYITLQQPNQQLYVFNGQIQIEERGKEKENQFIKINQYLYRDSVLRNTKSVIGVIAYAGKNTKAMLNNSKSIIKMSSLQKKVNFYMIFIFLLQFVLLTICAILRITLYYSTDIGQAYIQIVDGQSIRNYAQEGAITAATYFILLNTMIPISLLVSIEIVKFAQGIFIGFDMFMKKGDINAKAFRSSINEQLGMVEYVFTDKTGTLTQNKMVLTKLVIGNSLYETERQINSELYFNEELRKSKVESLQFLRALNEGTELKTNQLNSLMLYFISTCHQCILTQRGQYHGSSPDQITLVSAAANIGFSYKENSLNQIGVQINNQVHKSSLVQLFEFDSDRKRMSVILSHPLLKGNKILFCKGADNIIQQRLKSIYTNRNKISRESERYNLIQNYVNEFSKVGLRTLLFGFRIIKQEQYKEFKYKINKLNQSQKTQMDLLINKIEQQLELVGASGVQDKLQDQVQSVIHDMIRANIKVCMLTGDKLETAENIAKSCKLFSPSDPIIKITQKSSEQDLFQGYCEAKKLVQSYTKFVVLVEGSALPSIISANNFIYLIQNCAAAVCCRITPKNKSQMVLLAKEKLNKLTLSIGDGANDVPMIMAGNIGIGLYGNEGMNAVQASDFAIPQFKGLWRLLFVHGRWNYNRIAELIKYFFYKNMVFTLAQLWFSYFCNFSGSSIYDAFYLALYNTIFTGGPVIVRALFQQDVNYVKVVQDIREQEQESSQKSTLKQVLIDDENTVAHKTREDPILKHLFPLLYSHTQKQLSFTPKIFALVILQSIVESIAVFALIYFGVQTSEYWIFSISLFTVILALVTIRICYDITYWTWLMVLTILFTSIIPYILFMYVMSILQFELAGTFQQIFIIPDFYLLILLAIGVGALIQGTFSIVNKYYFPTVVDFIRRQIKQIQSKINLNLYRNKSELGRQLQEIKFN